MNQESTLHPNSWFDLLHDASSVIYGTDYATTKSLITDLYSYQASWQYSISWTDNDYRHFPSDAWSWELRTLTDNLWARAIHNPTTLTCLDSLPLLKVESQGPALYVQPPKSHQKLSTLPCPRSDKEDTGVRTLIAYLYLLSEGTTFLSHIISREFTFVKNETNRLYCRCKKYRSGVYLST